MTAYAIDKFCHRLTVDPAHRNLAQEDLPAAMGRFDLTVRERNAIVAGDIGFLFSLGVHPLLLVRLHTYGIGGLTEVVYSERIRAWAQANAAETA